MFTIRIGRVAGLFIEVEEYDQNGSEYQAEQQIMRLQTQAYTTGFFKNIRLNRIY